MTVANGAAEGGEIRYPTRGEVRQAREAEGRGSLLTLHRTGGQAHVRNLSLANLATVAGLPRSMQDRILKVFNEAQQATPRALSWEQLARNQERQLRLADALCVAGFLKPRLVFDEADLDGDPYTLLVTDLHPEERLRYFNICLGNDEEAAKRLEPFPAPAVAGVPVVPAEPAAAAAVGVAGVGGLGV